MESSNVVGVVASCNDECLVVIRPELDRFGCQKLSQALTETGEVAGGSKGFEQRFEKRRVWGLLSEGKGESFQAVRE